MQSVCALRIGFFLFFTLRFGKKKDQKFAKKSKLAMVKFWLLKPDSLGHRFLKMSINRGFAGCRLTLPQPEKVRRLRVGLFQRNLPFGQVKLLRSEIFALQMLNFRFAKVGKFHFTFGASRIFHNGVSCYFTSRASEIFHLFFSIVRIYLSKTKIHLFRTPQPKREHCAKRRDALFF